MSTLPLSPWLEEHVRRIDLTALYRPFRDSYLALLFACHERGFDYYAISGTRLDAEQEALYAKGRKKQSDGSWTVTDASKIVTNAKPGSSAHNYGCAADSCLDKNQDRAGLQPGWSTKDYQVLGEEARKLGLDAGLFWTSFRDPPHVQLDLRSKGITTAQLRSIQDKGGMPAVYEYLDGFGWGTNGTRSR